MPRYNPYSEIPGGCLVKLILVLWHEIRIYIFAAILFYFVYNYLMWAFTQPGAWDGLIPVYTPVPRP